MIEVEVQKPITLQFTEEEYIKDILGNIPMRKPKFQIGQLVIPATGSLKDFKTPWS